MKIIISLINDEGTHEEIDNLANDIQWLLEDSGYEGVEQNSEATGTILLTCNLSAEQKAEAEAEG